MYNFAKMLSVHTSKNSDKADMKNKIIKVSENSNIETGENSAELLLSGICQSFECEDFRANDCKMNVFLNIINNSEWRWSQNWHTPTKFFLHIVKSDEEALKKFLELFEELKNQWDCMSSQSHCNCAFRDEMKLIRNTLSDIADKR